MKTLYLEKNKLSDFLKLLNEDYEVYAPGKIKGRECQCNSGFKFPACDYILNKLSDTEKENICFNEYRCIEPLRTFFSPLKENLDCPNQNKDIAIFGAKSCDLFSLKIQDFVFLGGEVKDPFYEHRRRHTLIISTDCLSFKESCFCLAQDIRPYATEGFDLNFSLLYEGFLVDVNSKEAEEIIDKAAGFFIPATPELVTARDNMRNSFAGRLAEHLDFHSIPSGKKLQEIVKGAYKSDIWHEEAEKCVECGACSLTCATCHCFLLAENRLGNANEIIRLWDTCSYANFARVAGGANPLKSRYQRLRNRFLKKFDFFPANTGLNACCGCGRCIDACPGRIDIRDILKKLNENHIKETLDNERQSISSH